MKKILSVLVLFPFLAGCSFMGFGAASPTVEPTMSDSEMSTRVAQILTSMPTMTQAILPVATIMPTATQQSSETTSISAVTATSTSESGAAAETPQPSNTPTTTSTESTTSTVTSTPTATATNTPVPTIYPTGDPRSSLGTADWTDPFNGGTYWPVDEDTYSIGKIENGMYVITGKQKINAWRMAPAQSLTDAYIEVLFKTTTCLGRDGYGIYFRVPNIHENDQGYLYGISCDGQYYLKKWDGKVTPNGSMITLVDYTSNSNINAGSNQSNRVGVMAVGSRLMLYVNGVLVNDSTDSTYKSGYFGLFVHPVSTVPLTIQADEASYWLNPTVP
jgi:hypothetical protein